MRTASAVVAALVLALLLASSASAAPSLGVDIDPEASEVQRLITASTTGSFRLGFGPDVTPELPIDASAAQVQSALNALPSISAGGGSVSVNYRGNIQLNYYTVTFDGGPLAHTDVPLLTATVGSVPLGGRAEKLLVDTVAPGAIQPNDQRVDYRVNVTNTGDAATDGAVTAEVELPEGTSVLRFFNPLLRRDPFSENPEPPQGWSCTAQPASGSEPAKGICTRSDALAAGASYPLLGVAARTDDGISQPALATATVSGGGAGSAMDTDQLELTPPNPFGIVDFDTGALGDGGADYTQAGGHPLSVFASFKLPTNRVHNITEFNPEAPIGDYYNSVDNVKRVITRVPKGLVGNPLAIPELCPGITEVLSNTCPPGSVVGGVIVDIGHFRTGISPLALYAIKPERGVAAQFAFAETSNTQSSYTISARLDAANDYQVNLATAPIVGGPTFLGAPDVTLCRAGGKYFQNGGSGQWYFDGCNKPDDPGANPTPLITMPTSCGPVAPTTTLLANSWQNPDVFHSAESVDPALTNCQDVPFDPELELTPTSEQADAASGLDVDLTVPSEGLTTHGGISQSHLKKTVVTLPEGMSVNTSAATGLQACSDAQLALGTDDPTTCPVGSKIGTVEVTTPILEEHLTGDVVLRTPTSTDPTSGGMLRMAIVARNAERGLLVKLPGSAVADPATGRLKATFDDNPEVPFSDIEVSFKGGDRGLLAQRQTCNSGPEDYRSVASLLPWSRAHLPEGDGPGTQDPVDITQDWTVDGDCDHAFNPGLQAGMSATGAREGGAFSFKLTRPQGDQTLRDLTAKLPAGLLASIKGVPLCKDAQAAVGNCPAGSKIGVVDAKAGSGNPFVLEEKGEVFLTEGYKGGAYGLAVKVRGVAGPFRGAQELSPIIVRQALHVDPTTAQVTAISDPFPVIHHGVPLRVREITVLIDRDKFMLNPSGCSAKQIDATIVSAEGTVARPSNGFRATGCAALPFKPRLGLRLTGRKQLSTGKHPGVKAVLRQTGVGEAGIEKAVVRLPKSLALDPDNARALCEFDQGIKPDLEKRCPKGSIVGRAKATSPLLNKPLAGNVYFVKNVRVDKKTGNSIRTLPMLVVALRGEIAVNLRGKSSTTKAGKLVNTFDEVPDAPISQFNLNIEGGATGILAVTRTRRSKIDLCTAGRQVAEVDTDGQNGKRRDFDVKLKTPCPTKKAKRRK